MSEPADGLLIGALLFIPWTVLSRRVHAGYAAAGFPDLRPAHTPVFQFLAPEGNRVTELAARAGMSKQAMGHLVEYLVVRGYLERVPDPTDGRAQIVRRTARGWAVNRTARRLVAEIQADWARHLGEERMEELRGLLGELVAGLGYPEAVAVAAASGRDGTDASGMGNEGRDPR